MNMESPASHPASCPSSAVRREQLRRRDADARLQKALLDQGIDRLSDSGVCTSSRAVGFLREAQRRERDAFVLARESPRLAEGEVAAANRGRREPALAGNFSLFKVSFF